MIRIGTAGSSIARDLADRFPATGSTLERYAARFPALEINSSFHRPHRLSTWQRWHDSVPADFRFSVKLAKTITHQRKLVDCEAELAAFLAQVAILGDKLAVILVQLPPSLAFDPARDDGFFALLAGRTVAALACEPRHASWFTTEAEHLLIRHRVARVAADPALCPAAGVPGGWPELRYWRLHGSPVMYRSSYADRLPAYADAIRLAGTEAQSWCIFDNTASSAALADALELQRLLVST